MRFSVSQFHLKRIAITVANRGCFYMIYDIRTSESALDFVTSFVDMSCIEYYEALELESENNLDTFWEKYGKKAAVRVPLEEMEYVAFHITTSFDNCADIGQNGLRSLRYLLGHDSPLNRKLAEHGIKFDIEARTMSIDNRPFCLPRNAREEMFELGLGRLSYRIYRDAGITAFLYSRNPEDYAGMVHKRPEFLDDLAKICVGARRAEEEWIENADPYRVTFMARENQLAYNSFKPENSEQLTAQELGMSIKQSMLYTAIDRVDDALIKDVYLQIDDSKAILGQQIISIDRLTID